MIAWYTDASFCEFSKKGALAAVAIKNQKEVVEVRKLLVNCDSSGEAEILALFLVPRDTIIFTDSADTLPYLYYDSERLRHGWLKPYRELREKYNLAIFAVSREHKFIQIAHSHAISCLRAYRRANNVEVISYKKVGKTKGKR